MYQVLATNGAIVYIGNDGQLTASTGPTGTSGLVALGIEGSSLGTGNSAQTGSVPLGPIPLAVTAPGAAHLTPSALGTTYTVSGTTRNDQPSLGLPGYGSGFSYGLDSGLPLGLSDANGSFEKIAQMSDGRAQSTSISGFEGHSVSVIGNDQIVTYDDSNVFVDRDGLINANTGDTDSSGLNAVDVTGSTVRSGNSGDGENNRGRTLRTRTNSHP